MVHRSCREEVSIPAAASAYRPLFLLLAVLACSLPGSAKADIDVLNPPGRMVDIGGYRLYIDCRGEGSPTVVMEAGLGGLSLEWLPAQRFLGHYTHVCTYDRAGNGWSDAGPEPRTTSVFVDELHALLRSAEVPGPYVLVGHSFGGYTAQLFAQRYPHLTAGLVLVDSSHPNQVARFLEPPLNMDTAPKPDATGVMLMSGPPSVPAHLPEESVTAAMMLMSLRKTRMTVAREFLYFRDSGAELRAHEGLPPVPLVVITRGRSERERDEDRSMMIEQLWLQLQVELAHSSPRSAHLVARRSGHHIHLDQPQLVVDAVNMVLDFARADLANASQSQSDIASTWLAFDDATWLSDNLHRPPREEQLVVASGEPALPMGVFPATAGHLAGTNKPASQLIAYTPLRNAGPAYAPYQQGARER